MEIIVESAIVIGILSARCDFVFGPGMVRISRPVFLEELKIGKSSDKGWWLMSGLATYSCCRTALCRAKEEVSSNRTKMTYYIQVSSNSRDAKGERKSFSRRGRAGGKSVCGSAVHVRIRI
jgi:hypothetical protein